MLPDRPNFNAMTEEEAKQLPTLKIYDEATQIFPNAELWSYVHDMITMFHLTTEQIRRAYDEWVENGYDPHDNKGILKVAVNGWGKGKPKTIEPARSAKGRQGIKQETIASVMKKMMSTEP